MIDYEYMATSLANLSAIPVRLYRDGKFAGLFHTRTFKPDLAIWEEPNLFANQGSVSFYVSPNFLSYGLFRVKNEDVALVLGPVTQAQVTVNDAEQILRSMGEPASRSKELLDYLQTIPRYPLRNFLQILCTFAYFINGEKLSISDVLVDETMLPEETPLSVEHEERMEDHNTYELEQQMLSLIEFGRTDELKKLFRQPAAGHAGTMAQTAPRQQKNLFIVTATLVSRAAIRGGITPQDAFRLSDLYIQKVELLERNQDIAQLMVQMSIDYAQRVEALLCGDNNPVLMRKARQYILDHITQPLTTGQLATALGKSRPYLSTYFKQETGQGINEYITSLKIEEAKRLLTATSRPLIEIAEHLGFSSQSYFQNVFKKVTGYTPKEYREQFAI